MEYLVKQFADYLENNLNIRLQINSSKISRKLPLYLTQDYTFYDTEILGRRYILQVASSFLEVTPSNLKKQWENLREIADDVYPIYVVKYITAFNRKRLIQQKIPFVVPGNQMYLPDLAIDLREYFKRENQHREYLSPSAQHCLINFLLDKNINESNPSQLAQKLNYATMTMSRAINELVSFKLGYVRMDGKLRWFGLERSKLDLWQAALDLLRSPVSKIRWVNIPNLKKWDIPIAGESALSQLSDLNSPRNLCYAVGRGKWKEMHKDNISISESPDSNDVQIQIWRYDPDITAKDGMVDHLSLYLSLREVMDERVEGALKDMIGDYKW